MLKFRLVLVFCFVLSLFGSAQNFNKSYDGYYNTFTSWSVEKLASDTFFIITADIKNNRLGLSLLAIDSLGDTVYNKGYRFNNKQVYGGFPSSTFLKKDGTILLAGAIADTANYGHLVNFSRQGDTIWTKSYGDGIRFHTLRQVIENKDGDIVAIGDRSNPSNSGNGMAWLLKTDSVGNVIWQRDYSRLSEHIIMSTVYQSNDGGYILGGTRRHIQNVPPVNFPNINYDALVIKVDSMGVFEWDYIWDSPFDDVRAYAIQTKDGNYLFGSSVSDWGVMQGAPRGAERYKAALIKLDTAGNLLWQKDYSQHTPINYFSKILELGDSSIVSIGSRSNWQTTPEYGLIIKTDKDGNLLWEETYENDPNGTGNSQYLNDVVQLDDGGFLAVGEVIARPPVARRQDAWAIRVDSMGCILSNCTVGLGEVEEVEEDIVIYLNPTADGSLTIKSKQQIKEVSVYNQMGQEVYRSQRNHYQSQLELPPTSGIYFIRLLMENGQMEVKKVVKE